MDAVRQFVEQFQTEIVAVSISDGGQQIDWGRVHQIISKTVGHRLIMEHPDRYRPIGIHLTVRDSRLQQPVQNPISDNTNVLWNSLSSGKKYSYRLPLVL